MSDPANAEDKPIAAGRRLAHDLENDLAAIRIRSDVILQSFNSELERQYPLLTSDIKQVRDTAQQASEKARDLARWIAEQQLDPEDGDHR